MKTIFQTEEQADNYLNKSGKIKYYTIHEGYYDYLWKVVPELMHNEDVVMVMMENGYLLDDYIDSIGLELDEIDFNL